MRKKRCGTCHSKFLIDKDKLYQVSEQGGMLDVIIKDRNVFDAIDCPACGCQVLLNIRMAPFSMKGKK